LKLFIYNLNILFYEFVLKSGLFYVFAIYHLLWSFGIQVNI